jgi:hypothetical protein
MPPILVQLDDRAFLQYRGGFRSRDQFQEAVADDPFLFQDDPGVLGEPLLIALQDTDGDPDLVDPVQGHFRDLSDVEAGKPNRHARFDLFTGLTDHGVLDALGKQVLLDADVDDQNTTASSTASTKKADLEFQGALTSGSSRRVQVNDGVFQGSIDILIV